MWRHVRVADEPAWTVMTVLVFVVGLGPPLQTMSLDVTSVIGCEHVNHRVFNMKACKRDVHHRMREHGHHRQQHHR